MLSMAYKVRQVQYFIFLNFPSLKSNKKAINLFISSADYRYGPITTIRCKGRITKHISWSAFEFSKRDWERVKEVSEILAVRRCYMSFMQQLILLWYYKDSNQVQQYFSAKKYLMLWQALPAIEELQTAWEAKQDDDHFSAYWTAINNGLVKLNKYDSQFDEKPTYILALGMLCFKLLEQHPNMYHSSAPILQTCLYQACMGWTSGTRS